MSKIKIELPDGSVKEYDKGINGFEIAQSIGTGLANAALAVVVDSELYELNKPIEKSAKLKILTNKDHEGLKVLWHSAEHVLTMAIQRLHPEVLMAMGPATDEGYYFDFDSDRAFSQEDFLAIENEMKKIVDEDLQITRKDITISDARKLFKGNKYKQEWLDEIEARKDKSVTVYYTGDEFVDLCKGPHVPSTGKIGYSKLLSVASAYWRGDSKNQQLQRIYAISFPDKKMLKKHINMLEEAKLRDHRKIGRELDLFEVDEDIGPGLIIWLPKGNIIKEELENWAKETEKKWGYKRVTTPIITKEGLFAKKGSF